MCSSYSHTCRAKISATIGVEKAIKLSTSRSNSRLPRSRGGEGFGMGVEGRKRAEKELNKKKKR
jgi:hypothetical protein